MLAQHALDLGFNPLCQGRAVKELNSDIHTCRKCTQPERVHREAGGICGLSDCFSLQRQQEQAVPTPPWAEPAQIKALACTASLSEVGLLTWPFLGTPVAAAWEQCVLWPPASPAQLS